MSIRRYPLCEKGGVYCYGSLTRSGQQVPNEVLSHLKRDGRECVIVQPSLMERRLIMEPFGDP